MRTQPHHGACDIVAEVAPWSVGDNMHLAVGQGDLLTSPLQMAVAYSTLANAFVHGGYGTVVRPHLGMEIDEADGGLVQTLSFPPARHVRLNYADLSLVMEGIHEAASQAGRHLRGRMERLGPGRSTPSTARRARPNTPARKISPGTCASSATPGARS